MATARTKTPTGREKLVTKQEFFEVFHDVCTRPEVYFLLVRFSSNKEFLDTKDLMRFLEAEQGVAQVSEADSLKLIQSHEPSEEGRQQGYLSLDGFNSYLTSAECHLFDREHNTVCQECPSRCPHYFINSSHNTYLIEDQLRGPSDVSGYIRALRMGCRCVEVDVWDGPDEEPVVCTGHTLSPPLVLRCVLEAIARFAFVASEYPLIVCIENHCSPPTAEGNGAASCGNIRREVIYGAPDEKEPYLPSPQCLKASDPAEGERSCRQGWEAEDGETAGLMKDLNTAWFRQNGNCGYVLRPAIMRQEVSYFSADTTDTVPGGLHSCSM
ncbi:unnamed protein product [Lampetra planeri]